MMLSSRPRILFCMHMPPPVHGAAMMGQYIHDSAVINTTLDCHYINIATASSVDDIGKGGLRKLWQILQKRREIINAVRKIRPDLVYITPNASGSAFYKDYLFVQQLKRMHCRAVMHFHNKGVNADKRRGLQRWLYKRFFAGTQVILLSELLYPDMAAFVPRANVHFCPNGIPDVEVCEKHAENNVPHVLFLSNLIRAKGVFTLLDACSILKQKQIIFHCDMVGAEGDISVEQLQQGVKSRGLQDIVTYHGAKGGDAKLALFKQADVFVLPTYYPNECFPLVLLEAMRSGVASVSTSEGAIPEMLEDGNCGVIIPSKNSEELAIAIEKLIREDALRQQIASRGRVAFETKYTLPIFEHRLASIISEVINQ